MPVYTFFINFCKWDVSQNMLNSISIVSLYSQEFSISFLILYSLVVNFDVVTCNLYPNSLLVYNVMFVCKRFIGSIAKHDG